MADEITEYLERLWSVKTPAGQLAAQLAEKATGCRAGTTFPSGYSPPDTHRYWAITDFDGYRIIGGADDPLTTRIALRDALLAHADWLLDQTRERPETTTDYEREP